MGKERYDEIKHIVKKRLYDNSGKIPYSEVGSKLFGNGSNYCRQEVRRRLKTLDWFIDEIETDDNEIAGNVRILSLSDFHIPFQLSIETFNSYKGKVDILQLNGDIVDMQSISKFGKSYRVPIMEEITMARSYLIELIKLIQPKKINITYGNHEVRFENYLSKHLENDMVELMPRTPLELIFVDGFNRFNKKENTKIFYEPLKNVFRDIDIDYTGKWWTKIGQTIFCHPLAFRQTPMATSEKAMQWFRNEGHNFDCLVMAHTHRIGDYKIGNTMLYEQGCCCDISKCQYSDGRLVNSQKEGFLYLIQNSNGEILADKSKLVYLN